MGDLLQDLRYGLRALGAPKGFAAVALAALALVTDKLSETLLFGGKPRDPITSLLAPAMPLAIGLLASYLPALRATAVNPVSVLRDE